MDGFSFKKDFFINDREAIAKLYRSERSTFFAFAAKWDLTEMEKADVFQDAMLAFIENVRKGKVELTNSSPSTYLFSIGKYMIFKRLNKQSIRWEPVENMPDGLVWDDSSIQIKEGQYARILLALEKMGEQCKKILTLFYYDGKDLDEIMTIMQYDRKEVLKSQKSRCLKQLREKCNATEE